MFRVTQEEERMRQESIFHMKTTHFESMSIDFKEKMDALSRKAGQEVGLLGRVVPSGSNSSL